MTPASDTSLLPPAEAMASFRTPASGISRGMRCFVGVIMPALRGLLDFPRWAQGRRDERRRGGGGGEAWQLLGGVTDPPFAPENRP